jgi:hypothetical protein
MSTKQYGGAAARPLYQYLSVRRRYKGGCVATITEKDDGTTFFTLRSDTGDTTLTVDEQCRYNWCETFPDEKFSHFITTDGKLTVTEEVRDPRSGEFRIKSRYEPSNSEELVMTLVDKAYKALRYKIALSKRTDLEISQDMPGKQDNTGFYDPIVPSGYEQQVRPH